MNENVKSAKRRKQVRSKSAIRIPISMHFYALQIVAILLVIFIINFYVQSIVKNYIAQECRARIETAVSSTQNFTIAFQTEIDKYTEKSEEVIHDFLMKSIRTADLSNQASIALYTYDAKTNKCLLMWPTSDYNINYANSASNVVKQVVEERGYNNFRDTQMEAMAMSIRPAMRGGQPSNAVVLGSPATGKTTAMRKVFELVEKNTEKVVCVYINCQIHTTRFGIFSQIYKKIFGHTPPETGVPFSRIYDQIMKELQKNSKSLIVAFDDINYLFQSNNANKVVYDLLRAYEEYPGVKSSIFAILSDLEFKYAFDKNVNTVFIPQEIIFPLYTYSEIEAILGDRVKAGFFPGVLSDDILEQVSMYTLENGDLRVGINLLRSCGNIAEADASREITQEHLDKAIDSIVSVNIMDTLGSLNDNEKAVLRIAADYDGIYTAGELLELSKEKIGISKSSFNRVIDKLEFVRLIDTKFTGKGVKGNSRQIILRFNPDEYSF